MKRDQAPSENKLHRAMHGRDVAEQSARGGVVGAAAGAALRHLGHKAGPGIGAGVGAALGAAVGHLKGKERTLRDTATQERQQMRIDARTKKSALMMGFDDRIKESSVLSAMHSVHAAIAPAVARANPMLANLGRAVVGGGMRIANAAGVGQQATGLVRQGLSASPNLMRNVGAATAAGGAALGAGYAAGKVM